jgi:hypothetical protein
MPLISVQIADGDQYVPVPYGFRVRSMTVSPNAAPGAAGSVTLTDGTNSVNVADVADGAAGDVATGTADTTNGSTDFGADTPMVLTASSTNSVSFGVTLDLDEFLVV